MFMEHITLKIGEKKTFKKSFFSGAALVYCGMPTEKTFSLGLREVSGYQGFGLNLYFKTGDHTISVKGVKLHVVKVNSEEIVLGRVE